MVRTSCKRTFLCLEGDQGFAKAQEDVNLTTSKCKTSLWLKVKIQVTGSKYLLRTQHGKDYLQK